ncbi:YbaB/EbfC family nucleoid-associated protein [Streptomyces sp. 900105755]|uniref:YbaB/EbfC family nucleoid-associated protein n=1 Tax=Streptomyces sp. 900105755 TaxID=3154389 RepID=A0ABV1TUU4_9ACTN
MPEYEHVDFSALAHRARRMRGTVAEAQLDLRNIEATGHSSDGMVSATVSADSRVVDLRIDPSVIDPDNPERLVRLVIEAVDGAHGTATEQRAEVMSGITGGLQDILAGLNGEQDEQEKSPVVPRFPERRPRRRP